jgi:lysophospholipase L1-like esterase
VLKKIIWFSILLLSIIGIITLSAGFYQALTITGQSSQSRAVAIAQNGTATNPSVSLSKKSNTASLLILGDSIAKGTGDETGKGFSSYLRDYLKNQTPKEVVVNNIGIDGLQTNGLLELVRGEKLKPAIEEADLLLISIGGNDLRQIRRLTEMTRDNGFQATFDNYVTGLTSILKAVRRINSKVFIIFIGLYYPTVQDIFPGDIRYLLAWNEGTQKIIDQDKQAIFIPTYDLFKLNVSKYIAVDALHPNASGYRAIADRIGKNIEGYFNGSLQPGQKSN